jgi:hypothetical protein
MHQNSSPETTIITIVNHTVPKQSPQNLFANLASSPAFEQYLLPALGRKIDIKNVRFCIKALREAKRWKTKPGSPGTADFSADAEGMESVVPVG